MSVTLPPINLSSTQFLVLDAITQQYRSTEEIQEFFENRNVHIHRDTIYRYLSHLEDLDLIYGEWRIEDGRGKLWYIK